jgi:DNA anti-recombination protein RmuC
MREKRKAYEKELAAQLGEWRAQLEMFKASTDKVRHEKKSEYFKIAEVLQGEYLEARSKLEELEAVSNEEWKDFKDSVENTRIEVNTAFNCAASKLMTQLQSSKKSLWGSRWYKQRTSV